MRMKLWMWLAWKLPRGLVYCFCRARHRERQDRAVLGTGRARTARDKCTQPVGVNRIHIPAAVTPERTNPMTTVTQHLRRRLLAAVPDRLPDLDSLRRSERSPEFERLRLNRKIVGAMRYGLMGAPGKPSYDRVADMRRRLKLYSEDRNAEHLVDVANLAELEFVEGTHRGIVPQDDGPHTQENTP